MINKGDICNISNWCFDNAGIYRYWISDVLCYEIQVINASYTKYGFSLGTLKSDCNLYKVSINQYGLNRESMFKGDMIKCIEVVVHDATVSPNNYSSPYPY